MIERRIIQSIKRPTFAAFLDFKSLTLSPWATILLLISAADEPPEEVDGDACGGTQPGFQSDPVADL